ncbi:MAG: hypothetical protein IJB45_05440 [Clostridia bacterium]|nr:hypothetical protein [Clostridia bacterium]
MENGKKQTKKNKLAFPIGIIAIILAIVGAVTVVGFLSDTVKDLTDNTAKKKEYEKMLTPVVMFDPDPFDDLTQADVSQLLNSAVWALLMSEEGTEQYAYSEGETFGIIVPQADIEQYFVGLFGNEINIASMHSSVDMSDYDITYDAAQQSYVLPVTGIESAYTPKVYDIEKQGSSVILTVGYIGNKAWVQLEDGEYAAPEADKFMKITLRERSGGMYIASIQAADGQEIAGTAATTVRPPETEETTTLPSTELSTETLTETVTDENGETVTMEAAEVEEETSEEETDEYSEE